MQKFIVGMHFEMLSSETRKVVVVGTDEKFRFEIKDVLEMEMKILEAINYYLVVFHPYRSLSQ